MSYPSNLPARELKQLYRDLLHHARSFPSVKRAAIIIDIKEGERPRCQPQWHVVLCVRSTSMCSRSLRFAEFREKAKERDPKKVAHAIEVGLRGLETLRKYTGGSMAKNAPSWNLHLDQDPLGQKIVERKRAEEQAAAAAKLREEKKLQAQRAQQPARTPSITDAAEAADAAKQGSLR